MWKNHILYLFGFFGRFLQFFYLVFPSCINSRAAERGGKLHFTRYKIGTGKRRTLQCGQKEELVLKKEASRKSKKQKAKSKKKLEQRRIEHRTFSNFAICKRNTLPLSYSPFMHACLVDLLGSNLLILIYTGTSLESVLPMFCRPNAGTSLVQHPIVAPLS